MSARGHRKHPTECGLATPHWSLCTLWAVGQRAKEGANFLAMVIDPDFHKKL